MKFILASQSPRRQELLKLISKEFSVIPADIDEALPDTVSPDFGPEFLSIQKAAHIAANYQDNLVIGADTGVFLDNTVLGKPKTTDEAKQMLAALSGRMHRVITGCALFYKGRHLSFSETTGVEFYPLTANEINLYVATGEPMDKAGAYGIQGGGSLFVKKINGDYFNVVGLPVGRLNRELKNFLNICGECYEKE